MSKFIGGTEICLVDFQQRFCKDNLKVYCLPDFFLDLCQGWTHETLQQVYMTITKKQSAPLKLWMDSAEEMRTISNKRQTLAELFEWLDFK